MIKLVFKKLPAKYLECDIYLNMVSYYVSQKLTLSSHVSMLTSSKFRTLVARRWAYLYHFQLHFFPDNITKMSTNLLCQCRNVFNIKQHGNFHQIYLHMQMYFF